MKDLACDLCLTKLNAGDCPEHGLRAFTAICLDEYVPPPKPGPMVRSGFLLLAVLASAVLFLIKTFPVRVPEVDARRDLWPGVSRATTFPLVIIGTSKIATVRYRSTVGPLCVAPSGQLSFCNGNQHLNGVCECQ